MKLTFSILPETFAVCRLEPGEPAPDPPDAAGFWSLTVTEKELSLVLPEAQALPSWTVDPGWRVLRIEGTLDLNQVGIMASLSQPLALEDISIFTVSTFQTDYILVKEAALQDACKILIDEGHSVKTNTS
jgi:hypothetical protein